MLSCNSTSISSIGQAAILIGSQRASSAAVAHRLAENSSKGATVMKITQLCTGPCGQIKPLSDFAKDKRIKSGYSRRCRECDNARGRAEYEEKPERRIWLNMNARCYNPKNPAYKRYGGRGIGIYPDWRGEYGFERFLAYVGRRPSPQHSIDRFPNPTGNYEPCNVRWATIEEQNRNRGDYNTRLTFNGQTKTIAEWSLETGFSAAAICARLKYEWTVERTLTEPLALNSGTHPKVEFNGERFTAHGWARRLGVPRTTFYLQIRRAGSIQAVLIAYLGKGTS
jgi:hypothetical protein